MKSLLGLDAATGAGSRLAWELRRLVRRLGWHAVTALFALALSVVATWQANQLALRQRELVEQIHRVQLAAVQPAHEKDTGPAAVGRELEAFYAYLPAHQLIPDQLKQLAAAAEKHGLVLEKADYKAQQEDAARFLRYQVTLPLKGTYPDVRDFIARALLELPTLTLDSVAFRRERIDSKEVEARIHFVLLVKSAQAKGSLR